MSNDLTFVNSKEFKVPTITRWVKSAINKDKFAKILEKQSKENVIITSMEIGPNNELINKVTVWKKK